MERGFRWAGGLLQVAVIVAIGAAAFAFATGQGTPSPADTSVMPADDVPSVPVITPAAEPFVPEIELTGRLEIVRRVAIAPQVEGRVIAVSDDLKIGAMVTEGSMLLRIDPTDFELELRQSEAEVALAAAALEELEAEAALRRTEWARQYNGQREITRLAAREPQLAAARARLEAAEAARDAVALKVERTTVTAPATGRVLAADLAVGEVLRANEAVAELSDFADLEVVAAISQADLGRLGEPVGRTVQIVGRPDIAATIARVDAELDTVTRLASVRIPLPGVRDIRVGTFKRVIVAGDRIPDAVAIPKQALQAGDRVFVVEGDTLAARAVTLLAIKDDTVFVAAFDIADGLVTQPPANARDGGQVHVLRQATVLAAQGR